MKLNAHLHGTRKQSRCLRCLLPDELELNGTPFGRKQEGSS